MSKEYTYKIDKYTIGVDENGEDGIGLTIAIIKNGEINFLGNCYGENARCIDLLIKENKELKKHLKVPKACNLKTLEDYKSYYEDTTKEQILEDTYIEYCAYVNLAHRYSKLKKQLEKYENPKDMTLMMMWATEKVKDENEELKKQLSSKTLELEKNKTGYIRSLNNQLSENIEPDPEDFYLAEIEEKANDYDKLLIQQKEFIKHLTDEINKIKGQIKNYDIWHEVGTDINFLIVKKQFYIEILQKYKEIIGNDINVGSKGENK